MYYVTMPIAHDYQSRQPATTCVCHFQIAGASFTSSAVSIMPRPEGTGHCPQTLPPDHSSLLEDLPSPDLEVIITLCSPLPADRGSLRILSHRHRPDQLHTFNTHLQDRGFTC